MGEKRPIKDGTDKHKDVPQSGKDQAITPDNDYPQAAKDISKAQRAKEKADFDARGGHGWWSDMKGAAKLVIDGLHVDELAKEVMTATKDGDALHEAAEAVYEFAHPLEKDVEKLTGLFEQGYKDKKLSGVIEEISERQKELSPKDFDEYIKEANDALHAKQLLPVDVNLSNAAAVQDLMTLYGAKELKDLPGLPVETADGSEGTLLDRQGKDALHAARINDLFASPEDQQKEQKADVAAAMERFTRDHFTEMDKDGDKHLSEEEIRACMIEGKYPEPAMSKQILQDMLDNFTKISNDSAVFSMEDLTAYAEKTRVKPDTITSPNGREFSVTPEGLKTTIKPGDSPWRILEDALKAEGNPHPSNSEIVAELNRLEKAIVKDRLKAQGNSDPSDTEVAAELKRIEKETGKRVIEEPIYADRTFVIPPKQEASVQPVVNEATVDRRSTDDIIRGPGNPQVEYESGGDFARAIRYADGTYVGEDDGYRVTRIGKAVPNSDPPEYDPYYDIHYGTDGSIDAVYKNGKPVDHPPGAGVGIFTIDPEHPEKGIVFDGGAFEVSYGLDGVERTTYEPTDSKERAPTSSVKSGDTTTTKYNDGTLVTTGKDGNVTDVTSTTGEVRHITTDPSDRTDDGTAVKKIDVKIPVAGGQPLEYTWEGTKNKDGTYTYTEYDKDHNQLASIQSDGPMRVNSQGERVYKDHETGDVVTSKADGTTESKNENEHYTLVKDREGRATKIAGSNEKWDLAYEDKRQPKGFPSSATDAQGNRYTYNKQTGMYEETDKNAKPVKGPDGKPVQYKSIQAMGHCMGLTDSDNNQTIISPGGRRRINYHDDPSKHYEVRDPDGRVEIHFANDSIEIHHPGADGKPAWVETITTIKDGKGETHEKGEIRLPGGGTLTTPD